MKTPVEALKLVKLPCAGLLTTVYVVSGLLSASLPVKVPLTAVFSLVLIDWPLATGVTLSTTLIDTVAAVLVLVPSDTVKVKLSAP